MPQYRASQSDVVEWAKQVASHRADVADVGRTTGSRKATDGAIERIYRASAITARSSVIPDYTTAPGNFVLHPPNWRLDPPASTAARMAVYRREAPPLAVQAAEACFGSAAHVARERISHLIVVSCTGFSAPGLDAQLVEMLGLRPDVERLIIGFMGCYAAFNALRTADAICRAHQDAHVLIVCVELCSLHFQGEHTMNNVVANSLFGDGAAAALVTPARPDRRRPHFDLIDSLTRLDRGSEDQMTWTIGDSGFEMRLTAEVPSTLRRSIASFVQALLTRNGLELSDIGFWAIHPGGRRIVEAVQERLELSDEAVAPSFGVLADHGNMSSPTIFFVLERILERPPAVGALGVAMAFGPGLTLESALLRAA